VLQNDLWGNMIEEFVFSLLCRVGQHRPCRLVSRQAVASCRPRDVGAGASRGITLSHAEMLPLHKPRPCSSILIVRTIGWVWFRIRSLFCTAFASARALSTAALFVTSEDNRSPRSAALLV
jgi:hypothetical protein